MLYLAKYSASMLLEKIDKNYTEWLFTANWILKNLVVTLHIDFLVNFAQIPLGSQLCAAVLHLHWHN